MSDSCCEPINKKLTQTIKKVLWISLILNGLMFIVEFSVSFYANSVSLKADSIDFLGDTFNYGISLYVLSSSLKTRSVASILKATSMGLFGVWVIYEAATNALYGSSPDASAMGILGFTALVVNVFVALLLFKFRDGDSNMQSVWLCSRNDAIGNIAVMIAASGVFLTKNMWPDLIVAFIMGTLGLTACYRIFKKAIPEYKAKI